MRREMSWGEGTDTTGRVASTSATEIGDYSGDALGGEKRLCVVIHVIASGLQTL